MGLEISAIGVPWWCKLFFRHFATPISTDEAGTCLQPIRMPLLLAALRLSSVWIACLISVSDPTWFWQFFFLYHHRRPILKTSFTIEYWAKPVSYQEGTVVSLPGKGRRVDWSLNLTTGVIQFRVSDFVYIMTCRLKAGILEPALFPRQRTRRTVTAQRTTVGNVAW
jgi:hypothetical protein